MALPRTEDSRRNDGEHRRAANRAIGISALGLLVTGGIELLLASLTQSVGLLGDAIHNLSDVSTSLVVFAGFFISKRPASERYPYGLERAEDIAGLGVALVIWAFAAFAAFAAIESYRKLVSHSPTTHLALGMLGACIGIVGNQLVAWYKRRVGGRIHSATLLADAKHSWLDAISSAGALAGLIAVALGFPLGDPIAGFAITAFIAHVGWEVTHDVVHHLMDGVDVDHVEAARRAAEEAGGTAVPVVRGRWVGRSLRFEVEPDYPATMTIAAADALSEWIRQAVRATSEQVSSVTVSPRVARRVRSEPEDSMTEDSTTADSTTAVRTNGRAEPVA